MESTTPTLCKAPGNNFATDHVKVTFISELGDLPALKVASTEGVTSVVVSDVVQGTRVNEECSGRGTCGTAECIACVANSTYRTTDTSTGTCKCFKGYTSGDGLGGKGTRGDCGGQDVLAK